MNTDIVLLLAALIILAISGLLALCLTEAKGKNTAHARKERAHLQPAPQDSPTIEQNDVISH